MTDLRAIIYANSKRVINFYQLVIYVVMLHLIVISHSLFSSLYMNSNSSKIPEDISIATQALQISLIAILFNVLALASASHDKEANCVSKYKARHRDEELDRIRDSIDMFYLPLHDLLTTYDEEDFTSRAKKQRIAEI